MVFVFLNMLCLRKRSGSLLIEALIGIAVFGIFATATFLTLLTGQEGSETGSARVRGVFYTEQSIEVAKSIRNTDFSELTLGQHGYTLDETGMWVLSGSYLSRYGFNNYMNIESIADNKIRITARTAWKHGYHRSGSTVLSIELADWQRPIIEMGDWSQATEVGNIKISGAPPIFEDVVVEGDYAYVTSNDTGDGLYIFDISDQSSPVRVSDTFVLGGASHKPIVYKDTLYLAVEDGGNEIQAYDVTDPLSLDVSTVPIATYNLPGDNNRANALARRGSTLFVGTDYHEEQSEVYALNIATAGSITLLDDLDLADDPTVYDAYVHGNYLHLATDKDTQEMIVIDVSDPTDMELNAAYNGTDVHDAYAVRANGTGFYLGRFQGSSIDEYLLITGTAGNPSNDPLDTFGADMGNPGQGTVNAMDVDPVGCYAFMATDFQLKELQIRSARDKGVPEEKYIDLDTDGQGIYYNMMNDRLYMTTGTGFHIFAPGSNTGACL